MGIEHFVNNGLCISCGICAGNCPKECISFIRTGYLYVPHVDSEKCVNCNICTKVCPNIQLGEYKTNTNLIEYLIGDWQSIFSAKTRDNDILKESTSGGVISQLILSLIENSIYNVAFTIRGYNYENSLIETEYLTRGDSIANTYTSRYLMVSHQYAIQYILTHRNEKVIIIGTGCAIQGFINTINLHKLNRDNYLLIGLFCDKTMHNGVIEFFRQHPINKGRSIKEFHFRSKKSGGWLGNIRIVYDDDSVESLKNTERIEVKDYFMPERCLYCLDKLNKCSDISVGDDYSCRNNDSEGRSTVILRTDIAVKIWKTIGDLFITHDQTVDDLKTAQLLEHKKKNYQYAIIKGIYPSENIAKTVIKEYKKALYKMNLGRKNNGVYALVKRDIERTRTINRLHNLIFHPTRIINKIFHRC